MFPPGADEALDCKHAAAARAALVVRGAGLPEEASGLVARGGIGDGGNTEEVHPRIIGYRVPFWGSAFYHFCGRGCGQRQPPLSVNY